MIKRKALDINRMDGNSRTLCCQLVILQHMALSVARDMLKICPAFITTKSGKTSSA